MSLNTWAIRMIEKYQKNKELIGSGRCKHYPSCSNYAIGCYKKFNFIKASFLMVFRILRCNPLTTKVYDPVPLSRSEKKELKALRQKVLSFMPTISKHYNIYSKSLIQDLISLIYESTFGPYYLKDEINNIKDAKNYLLAHTNSEFKLENIGNDYARIYLTKNECTDEMAENLLENINKSSMSDVNIQMFNEKLYLLKQMIKKKELPLDYDEVYNYIEDYLTSGHKYLGHSNIYKNTYSINYIITLRKN